MNVKYFDYKSYYGCLVLMGDAIKREGVNFKLKMMRRDMNNLR